LGLIGPVLPIETAAKPVASLETRILPRGDSDIGATLRRLWPLVAANRKKLPPLSPGEYANIPIAACAAIAPDRPLKAGKRRKMHRSASSLL